MLFSLVDFDLSFVSVLPWLAAAGQLTQNNLLAFERVVCFIMPDTSMTKRISTADYT